MNEPLSVLCYLHCFDSGGVELTALRLCSQWTRSGVRVTLLIGRDEGPSKAYANGLDQVCFSSGPFSTRRFESLWMMLCLWRQLRRERPDIIFCAGNTYAVVAVAVRLLLGRRCPPIVVKVSNALDRRDMNPIVRAGYAAWLRLQGLMLDHVVGTSPASQAEILTAMRLTSDRLSIIRNPALTDRQLKRLGSIDRGPAGVHRRFLAAGRLVQQKRFDLLIRAFLAIASDRDQLVILGEGPERRPLEKLITILGGADRICLPGHVQDTFPWFQSCETFVLCSDYEGLPSVVIEALASGMAIVATDCSPALRDLLEPNLGLLVEPGDVRPLAQAMASVSWASPSTDRTRAKAQLYCVEQAAPKYVELMRRLVGRAPVRAAPQSASAAEASAP